MLVECGFSKKFFYHKNPIALCPLNRITSDISFFHVQSFFASLFALPLLMVYSGVLLQDSFERAKKWVQELQRQGKAID